MSLTEKQEQVLNQVKELMGEHFDTHVIVFHSKCKDDDSLDGYGYRSRGEFHSTLGLLNYASTRMFREINEDDPI